MVTKVKFFFNPEEDVICINVNFALTWTRCVLSTARQRESSCDNAPLLPCARYGTITAPMEALFSHVLPFLTPSEQAVYLRLWKLTHAEDKPRCAIRYEDLARLAHVSVSTLKRVLKKLVHRGLVQVEWQTKSASLFTVHIRSLSPSPTIDLGLTPKLYDFFSDEDRSLFLSCKRSLSPNDQCALDHEAGGHPLTADVLLFRRTFGPDRQRKYEDLIAHLTHNGRPN